MISALLAYCFFPKSQRSNGKSKNKTNYNRFLIKTYPELRLSETDSGKRLYLLPLKLFGPAYCYSRKQFNNNSMGRLVERNVAIAEENILLSGHPAKDKFGDWSDEVKETIGSNKEEKRKETPEEIEKRIKELDELIDEKIK